MSTLTGVLSYFNPANLLIYHVIMYLCTYIHSKMQYRNVALLENVAGRIKVYNERRIYMINNNNAIRSRTYNFDPIR